MAVRSVIWPSGVTITTGIPRRDAHVEGVAGARGGGARKRRERDHQHRPRIEHLNVSPRGRRGGRSASSARGAPRPASRARGRPQQQSSSCCRSGYFPIWGRVSSGPSRPRRPFRALGAFIDDVRMLVALSKRERRHSAVGLLKRSAPTSRADSSATLGNPGRVGARSACLQPSASRRVPWSDPAPVRSHQGP